MVAAVVLFALSITGVWWNGRTIDARMQLAQNQDRANFVTLCNMYKHSSARGVPVAVLQQQFHHALTHGPHRLRSREARMYAERLAEAAHRLAVSRTVSSRIACPVAMPDPDKVAPVG